MVNKGISVYIKEDIQAQRRVALVQPTLRHVSSASQDESLFYCQALGPCFWRRALISVRLEALRGYMMMFATRQATKNLTFKLQRLRLQTFWLVGRHRRSLMLPTSDLQPQTSDAITGSSLDLTRSSLSLH